MVWAISSGFVLWGSKLTVTFLADRSTWAFATPPSFAKAFSTDRAQPTQLIPKTVKVMDAILLPPVSFPLLLATMEQGHSARLKFDHKE
jgi:hypothetical protein